MLNSTNIQIQVLKEEIVRWENTAWLLGIRIKAAKRIEDKAMESVNMAELEKVEKVIEFYNSELKKIENDVETKK